MEGLKSLFNPSRPVPQVKIWVLRRNDGNGIYIENDNDNSNKDHQEGHRDINSNGGSGKKGSVRWRVTPFHAAAVFDVPPPGS